MLLFMFFEVAHIEILLITSFYFAHVFFPSFFVFKMDLYVLLEVGSSSEGFTTFVTNERLFLSMNAFVSVKV